MRPGAHLSFLLPVRPMPSSVSSVGLLGTQGTRSREFFLKGEGMEGRGRRGLAEGQGRQVQAPHTPRPLHDSLERAPVYFLPAVESKNTLIAAINHQALPDRPSSQGLASQEGPGMLLGPPLSGAPPPVSEHSRAAPGESSGSLLAGFHFRARQGCRARPVPHPQHFRAHLDSRRGLSYERPGAELPRR